MVTPTEYPTFYVTSKGSLKSPKGGLLQPGDIYPAKSVTDEKLEALFKNGNICTDLAEAFTMSAPITQPPLPTNEAGSDDVSPPPATSRRTNDAEQRRALRAAQQAAKDGVEVLGAGPVRIENKEIQPVTETDPSNVTLESLAGKHFSVAEYNAAKNN